jgi:TPR repeat protein
MSVLFKLLPVAAAGLVGMANADRLKKNFDVIGQVQVAATAGIEMQGIADAVMMDFTETEKLPLENFGQFLKENLREKSGRSTRDRSRDMWGTEYKIAAKSNGFEIQSAGPDTKWRTNDDLASFHALDGIAGRSVMGGLASNPGRSPANARASGSSGARAAPASPAPKGPSAEAVKKSVEFQQKRAAEGSAQAQYDLAMRYFTGDGVEKDQESARKWLEAAAKNGNSLATKRLKELEGGSPQK